MIYRYVQFVGLGIVVLLVPLAGAKGLAGRNAIELRVQNFTVPPSTGPVGHLLVQNVHDTAYKGKVQLKFPAGWTYTPMVFDLSLEPHESVRLPFTIDKAVDAKTNSYAVELIATDSTGGGISRKQNIVCASAPYFKPKIDGNIADWADSIPVTFVGNGKKTVIRTYWTKRLWSVCVEVEEAKLGGYRKNAKAGTVDAVQFALAVGGAETGSKPEDKANRYEFLIVDCPGLFAKDKCFLLARPGEVLGLSQEVRSLDGLEFAAAGVVVKRKGKTTVYECSIPFSAMPQIRPDTGREICFSILVHDPDDTGIRDWGKAAGLWQSQRNKYAWCSWQGVKWAEPPPYDNKIEWGLCSSKY